jgi:hypothetical protein
MKPSIPKTNGNRNPKLVISFVKDNDAVRMSYGRPLEGGGWDWRTKTRVSAAGVVEMCQFWLDSFDDDEGDE